MPIPTATCACVYPLARAGHAVACTERARVFAAKRRYSMATSTVMELISRRSVPADEAIFISTGAGTTMATYLS